MPEVIYEEIVRKFSHDLKVGDEFEIGGQHVQITKIITNGHDDLVLTLDIIGSKVKSRSKTMLILPKKIQIITLT